MRYDYNCFNGHQFELEFRVGSAPGSVDCPECGALALKQFASPNINMNYRIDEIRAYHKENPIPIEHED